MAMAAGQKASQMTSGGGPTSLRSTRIAGTRDNCSRGGRANPASTAIAVRMARTIGARLGGGRLVTASRPRNAWMSQAWAT